MASSEVALFLTSLLVTPAAALPAFICSHLCACWLCSLGGVGEPFSPQPPGSARGLSSMSKHNSTLTCFTASLPRSLVTDPFLYRDPPCRLPNHFHPVLWPPPGPLSLDSICLLSLCLSSYSIYPRWTPSLAAPTFLSISTLSSSSFLLLLVPQNFIKYWISIHKSRSSQSPCYGSCLDVCPKPHALTGGDLGSDQMGMILD